MSVAMLVTKSRFPLREMITTGLLPARLKTAYYRKQHARIGPAVTWGFGSVIIADRIEIGEGVSIGFGTYMRARSIKIAPYARIGSLSCFDAETITIGEDAKISEQVFVGGLSSPCSHFSLGARTILMQHTFVNVARPVTIGDDSGIGGKCTIFTHGSWQNMLDGYPVSFAPVTIGNNVWIPWQVFVMPGVTIGDGATIGANSLVTQNIPPGALAVGSPAKVIRTAEQYPVRPDYDQRRNMLGKMISEFCEYLEHSGIDVARDSQADSESISIRGNGRAFKCAVLYAAFNDDRRPDAQVVLSLLEMAPRLTEYCRAQHVMWLDIARKKRGGPSSPLGEELAEYLKRYGLRFARV